MNPVKAVIAANRFGLGAKPGELERIRRPETWLLDQLQGPSRTPAELGRLPDSASVLVEAQALRQAQREARSDDEDAVKKYGRWARGHYVDQASARYRHAAATDLPFHERLVHFWCNHFAVSADKQPLPTIAGLMENEAIRPHTSGRFYDLLLAVETHPAMILYLDNQRSVGPNSTLARRASRRQGRAAPSLRRRHPAPSSAAAAAEPVVLPVGTAQLLIHRTRSAARSRRNRARPCRHPQAARLIFGRTSCAMRSNTLTCSGNTG